MQINLCIVGTRGDIQAAIALGLGLKRAGHQVKLVSPKNFRALAGEYGLDFHPMRVDLPALVEHFGHPELYDSGVMGFRFIPEVINIFRDAVEAMTCDFYEASQETDLIIGGPASNWMAGAVAEKIGVPYIDSCLQPLAATRQFHTIFWFSPPAPGKGRGAVGAFNLFTYWLIQNLTWMGLRGLVNRCREGVLGLPPLRFVGNAAWPHRVSRLILAGFSEWIIPRPPEWDPKIHITGYWFVDTPTYHPPEKLRAFLEAGPPPVYIGFGSMPSQDPAAQAALVMNALRQAGRRGVIHTGRGVLGQGLAKDASICDTDTHPGDFLFLDSAPHDWLFPRMAAVVHHGGSGTTAAGLRAGVPSILIPAAADQFLWAQRISALGLGPKPIPRPNLTAALLAEAITCAMGDDGMRARAARCGEKIRAEDGVRRAVDLINCSIEA